MEKIKKFLKWFVIGFAAFLLISTIAWVVILKINYTVPILMYHSICDTNRENCRLIVIPHYFEKQMKFLHDNNYNVVYVYEIAEMIKRGEKIPHKTVAITFDDGLKDNYTQAYPILKKYNLPATMHVITDLVDNHDSYLTWEQIKEMSENGIDIGTHTVHHKWLGDIEDQEELRGEILGSKLEVEKHIDVPVKTFCYPGGSFNEKAKQIVKESGYRCAVITSPGPDYPNDDIFALKRLRISNTSRNLFVFWFKLTGSYLFIKERRDDY